MTLKARKTKDTYQTRSSSSSHPAPSRGGSARPSGSLLQRLLRVNISTRKTPLRDVAQANVPNTAGLRVIKTEDERNRQGQTAEYPDSVLLKTGTLN